MATPSRHWPALARADVRVWLFTAAVAAASAGVWILDLARFQTFAPHGGVSIPWWALAGGFYLAEMWVVHLHFRKQAHTLSLTELPLVLGLFFASPAAVLGAQVLGAGLALVVHRRQRSVKLAFNLVELPLCSGIALLVFRSLATTGATGPASWASMLTAAAVANTAGVILVASVIAVAERKVAVPQLARTLAISLIGAVATACVGLIGVELVESRPLALVLLAAPALACGLAFRGYMAQREQREHVEFLFESMRATHGAPEFGLAVGRLLVAARRLLRAEYAEILLASQTPGEPVLRNVSSPSGELLMHPEDLTSDVSVVFRQTAAADRPFLLTRRRRPHVLDGYLASRGIADGVLGPLRGEHRTLGSLFVGGKVGDVSTFDADDLTLFETFARHVSVLLENGRLEQSLAQLTALKDELRHQASHDALTALPNRVHFVERVAEALAQNAEGTAVLFLDLDRFKAVNDNWGHAAGDQLLRQVADRLRHTVRPGDIPARIGGDEFAVLLHDTDAQGAEHVALRLVEALGTTFSLQSGQLALGASIGIALGGQNAISIEDLLRNADVAMYAAKADARRHFAFYEPELHMPKRLRRQLALELGRGTKRGEIVVHYQPVVSLADGSVQAFEALARWQHPERDLLGPTDFLGVAEESGLIDEVRNSVLEQAFRFAGGWSGSIPEAAELGLWINLGPRELVRERLVEDLALALAHAGLDPRRVTVDITESSLVDRRRGTTDAIERLRGLGVRLSIDDFGSGYSSLSRLAQLPIEVLRIPKAFVDRLVDTQTDPSVVDAILRLADSLGLIAVGEGIEHPSQARRLRELGCSLGQGYLFGPPLTADEVSNLLLRSVTEEGTIRFPEVPLSPARALGGTTDAVRVAAADGR